MILDYAVFGIKTLKRATTLLNGGGGMSCKLNAQFEELNIIDLLGYRVELKYPILHSRVQ